MQDVSKIGFSLGRVYCVPWEIIHVGRLQRTRARLLRPVGDYPRGTVAAYQGASIAPRGKLSTWDGCSVPGRVYCAPWEVIHVGRLQRTRARLLRPVGSYPRGTVAAYQGASIAPRGRLSTWDGCSVPGRVYCARREIIHVGRLQRIRARLLRPADNTPPAPVFAGYIYVIGPRKNHRFTVANKQK